MKPTTFGKWLSILLVVLTLSSIGIVPVAADTCAVLNITQGPPGQNGSNGINGINGTNGSNGLAATIAAGTTNTLLPGQSATVTNSGNSSAAVFDFGIPRGYDGGTGPQGPPGTNGTPGPNNDAWYLWVNGTRPMSGNLNMAFYQIMNLTTGLTGDTATNKTYVDSLNTSMKSYVDSKVSSDAAPGANTQILYNANGTEMADANFTYDNSTGYVTARYFIGDGSGLTGIGATQATALTINAKAGANDLYKGQAVYVSGATGSNPTVEAVDNTASADESRVIGVMVANTAHNQHGLVRIAGTLSPVDTRATNANLNPLAQTWSAGDLLFATTGGGLTNVRPTSGRTVKVAYSLVGSGVNDILLVHGVENPVWVTGASGENVVLRVGDSVGANKTSIRNYANTEVAYIDSLGRGSFNGTDMKSQKITSVLDPTANQDAATKAYVDTTNSSMKGYVDAHSGSYNASYVTTSNTSYVLTSNTSYLLGTNTSVATTTLVTNTNTSMKGYVDAQDVVYNTSLKGYTDNLVTTTNTSMKGYVDSKSGNYNSSYVTLDNTSYVLTSNTSYLLGTNTSIATTTLVSNTNTSMKGYVDAQDIVYNTSLKGYTDNLVTTTNTSMKGYTDNLVSVTNTSMKGYVDAKGGNYNSSYATTTYVDNVNTSMKGYVDNQEIVYNTSLKGYTDNLVTVTNTSMKGYVDSTNTSMKGYVDSKVSGGDLSVYPFLNGTRSITGIWNFGAYNISNVAQPVAAQDASTKHYSDDLNTSVVGYTDNQIDVHNTSMKGYTDNQIDIHNTSMQGYVDAADLATLQKVYPVGSIYIATVNKSPSTLFGFGTWAAFGTGRMPVGINASDTNMDTVKETGGSLTSSAVVNHTHTATVTDPGHSHIETVNSGSTGALVGYGYDASTSTQVQSGYNSTKNTTGISVSTANPAGGVTSFSIMNPYIVVYMWERTA